MFKKFTNNEFIKNTSIIFSTTIGEKVFGIFRELLIAYFLGASEQYAQYLFLSIVIDILMVLGGENVMQVNLVPRFTRLIKENGSLNSIKIKQQAIKIALYLILFSAIIIGFKIGYNHTFVPSMISLNLILSLTLGVYFFNSTGLILQIANGQFQNYAKASIAFSMFSALLIIPFVYYFGVIGLALSRLFSIAIQYIWIWKNEALERLSPDNNEQLFWSDFNFYSIVTSNVYVLIIMTSRFFYTINNDTSITHYTYAVFFMGLVITTIVKSLSTVLLRNAAVEFNKALVKKTLLAVALVNAIYIVITYLYGFDIVKLVFLRGKFSLEDAIITSNLIVNLSPFVLLISILMILNQTIMAHSGDVKQNYMKISTVIFLVLVLLFIILVNYTNISAAHSVLYFSYTLAILLGLLSFYNVTKLDKKNN